jgi:aldehyde:ferredoxin oxidoreductase
MNRRLLLINPADRRWRLETLCVERLERDAREDYFVLSGETLGQYLLRRDPGALVIARGPLVFLSGNKTTVGYVSPLTGLPHYSFVGGRAAAHLLNLGLDAICLESGSNPQSPVSNLPYIVVSGRAPNLSVEFKAAGDLPAGQRSAFYWLLDKELGNDPYAGSIFNLGEGARLGYASANLAVEAIYHAGRGGAGEVFSRFAQALVLRGQPVEPSEFFAHDDSAFARSPNAAIAPLLNRHCARISNKTGGTIAKLYTTGADPAGHNTLPAANARRLGYALADLGSPKVLEATRQGQTGCHWCQVDCRHWHWVPADYAPGGRDLFLDDFEPTYAVFAMLDLTPTEDTLQARLDFLADVNRRLMLPIEQMGCDVMNVGLALAALFEGIKRGFIPGEDVPGFVTKAEGNGKLEAAVQAMTLLRSGQASEYPALRTVGDGPQALAERYPGMQDVVFTGGKGTLGNAGHSNALWTFLMPFSRFFSHYSGQIYKIDEALPPPGSDKVAYRACFQRVVQRMLQKEFFWVLCNALSMCAFTFVIFSQDGEGERLSDDDLLVRLLRHYGIHTTRADLEWFAQAFWAQSIDLKCRFGWKPPAPADFPRRVYEALALALERTPEELQSLMGMLIEEWRRQAEEVMGRFGYEVSW